MMLIIAEYAKFNTSTYVDRGPHWVKRSESGQDWKVAALRVRFYALSQSPVFFF